MCKRLLEKEVRAIFVFCSYTIATWIVKLQVSRTAYKC